MANPTVTHFLTITYVAGANGYRVESGYVRNGLAVYLSRGFVAAFPFHTVAAKSGRVVIRIR